MHQTTVQLKGKGGFIFFRYLPSLRDLFSEASFFWWIIGTKNNKKAKEAKQYSYAETDSSEKLFCNEDIENTH